MGTKETHDRIAVVLLHGIGEQRPMATLRGFVRGVFGKSGRSKPDRLLELFEVRHLDFKFSGSNVDCYELYWAHHMTSSSWLHIIKWLKRLFSISSSELRDIAKNADRKENFYTKIRTVTVVLLLLLLATVISGPGHGGQPLDPRPPSPCRVA